MRLTVNYVFLIGTFNGCISWSSPTIVKTFSEMEALILSTSIFFGKWRSCFHSRVDFTLLPSNKTAFILEVPSMLRVLSFSEILRSSGLTLWNSKSISVFHSFLLLSIHVFIPDCANKVELNSGSDRKTSKFRWKHGFKSALRRFNKRYFTF